MKRFTIDKIGNWLLCVCPWLNVLNVFSKAIIQEQKKDILISACFLLIEVYFILINRSWIDNYYMAGILILVLIASAIYSLKYTSQRSEYKSIKFLLPFILLAFTPALNTNAPYFLGIYKLLFIIFLIYLASIYGFNNRILLVCLISTFLFIVLASLGSTYGYKEYNIAANILLDITLLSICFDLNEDSLEAHRNKIQQLKNQTEQEETIQPEQSAIKSTTVSEHIRYQPQQTSAYTSHNKGWTTDDTVEKVVELLTIEDIINPISLCNEHEKAVRNLIRYFRKIQKQTVSEEELSENLDAVFNKVRFDDVRVVFLRSLSLVIENYAKHDQKVIKYKTELASFIQK